MDEAEIVKYPPIKRIQENAWIDTGKYQSMYEESVSNPEKFWGELAKERIVWRKPFTQVLNWNYEDPKIEWFADGTLNVTETCLDQHLKQRPNKTAIIWEGNEPGEVRTFTYSELHKEVCRYAEMLRAQGIGKGDRVAIYLPMIPELAFTMLACARIGAIHSIIFAGFSADSIKDRVLDSECCCVITANQGLRGAKSIDLKSIVDEALESVDCVKSVLVVKRTGASTEMKAGRDHFVDDILPDVSESKAEELNAEDPLFILYTSGSTGKPKGVVHTQAGYLLYTSVTHQYVFDYKEEDVYFCAADIGWITGHSYIVYGPLANGATTVMFESIPNYPDPGRYWDVVERHKVNIFYTAPTAIRAIAKEGDDFVKKYDRSSLRILGSVGEPINKDAWEWYYTAVGEEKCAVVDTWWQTETGGILISPLPGVTTMKPGSATKPLFGVRPVLMDEKGKELTDNNVKGRLCISFPWPGQARTVYGDHERFRKTYFEEFPGKYFTGDACYRDSDGDHWITGRVDDVLNVSGHRLGTAEIESAIVESGIVAEAAVVGMPHEVKGTGICAFCILKTGSADLEVSKSEIVQTVRKVIGPFAAPDVISCVPGLPKTRSGKIMRRILRKIAEGERSEFGDTTTLADPGVVTEIVKVHNS